jgi:PKD repeat protein
MNSRRLGILLLAYAAATCGEGSVSPNDPPVADPGGPYSSAVGRVEFDGRASSDPDGHTPLTYSWDFGDGQRGSGAQTTHTYAETGTYTVRLTVADAKGVSSDPATTTAQVTNVGPTVDAGAAGSVPAGAPYELSASFTDGGSSSWTYEIAWGDGETSTGSAASPIRATHAYDAEGSYTVRVTVRDQQGASGSDETTVAATAPVLLLAGDIGDCARQGDNLTADVLDGLPGIVMPLGDNAYLNGSADNYADCYGPSWGRHKDRTRPVAGNHDYITPGASGYFGYFGAPAGDPAKGYYAFSIGSWRVLVLNTGTEQASFIAAGSAQETWLRSELTAATQSCVLAVFHHPRFTMIRNRNPIRPEVGAFWDALYEHGADLVVNGHDHAYMRFAPQRPDGTADGAFGLRQITVGTGGGEGLYTFGEPAPNIEARNNETFGVLKLTLKAGGYDWRFMPAAGGSFSDSGSGNCHGRP